MDVFERAKIKFYVVNYRVKDDCHKPRIGTLQNACRRFDIDMVHTYMNGARAEVLREAKTDDRE